MAPGETASNAEADDVEGQAVTGPMTYPPLKVAS